MIIQVLTIYSSHSIDVKWSDVKYFPDIYIEGISMHAVAGGCYDDCYLGATNDTHPCALVIPANSRQDMYIATRVGAIPTGSYYTWLFGHGSGPL